MNHLTREGLFKFTKNNYPFLIFALAYFFFWSLFYLIEPIRVIILKETSQTLFSSGLFLATTANLLIIFLIYSLFIKRVKKIQFKKLFALSVLINAFILFIWPITSSDILSYVYQGRVWAVFSQSPYLVPYEQLSSDVFYGLLKNKWSSHVAPYGPVLVFINSLYSLLFKESLVLNVFSLKLFFAAISIANGYLIYKISKSSLIFYLYAFNPLILFEFTINGHNDSLFIFFVLMSILFFINNKNVIREKIEDIKIKRYLLSFLFMTLSFLTKFISLIFLPIITLIMFLDIKRENRIKFILGIVLIFSISLFVFYKPLVENFSDILIPIIKQSEIKGSYSILVLLLKNIFYPISSDPLSLSVIINKIIFFIFYFFVLLKITLKKNFLTEKEVERLLLWSLSATLLVFYATFFSWLMPWYFALLITLFLINYKYSPSKEKIYLLASLFLTFYGILYYIILR